MEDTLEFVQDTQKLSEKVKQFEDDLILLLQQIMECCFFVRKYASLDFTGLLNYIRGHSLFNAG